MSRFDGFPIDVTIDPLWDDIRGPSSGELTELSVTLREAHIGRLRRADEAGTGRKGTVETLAASLSSAAVVTGLVQALKAWLNRSRCRSVTLTVRTGESERVVRLETSTSTDEAVKAIMMAALASEPAERPAVDPPPAGPPGGGN